MASTALSAIGLAALDAMTGAATSWNPGANKVVLGAAALMAHDLRRRRLYSRSAAAQRQRVAALDTATGAATAWNPSVNGTVYTLALRGPEIYAGGFFTAAGGAERLYLAAISRADGRATGWNPRVNSVVRQLAARGETIYAGGVFNSVGGVERSSIAALDRSTGALEGLESQRHWRLSIRSWSAAQRLYVGGSFDEIGGQPRENLAALRTSDGAATSWNPGAGGAFFSLPQVKTLALDGKTLYVGGGFIQLGGQPREAARRGRYRDGRGHAPGTPTPTLNICSWAPRSPRWRSTARRSRGRRASAASARTSGIIWRRSAARMARWLAGSPIPTAGCRRLALSDGALYVGGDFSSYRRKPRDGSPRLGALAGRCSVGRPTPITRFTPYYRPATGSMSAVSLRTSAVQPRQSLAAFDLASGALTPWQPQANGSVLALAAAGSARSMPAGTLPSSTGGYSPSSAAWLSGQRPRRRSACFCRWSGANT